MLISVGIALWGWYKSGRSYLGLKQIVDNQVWIMISFLVSATLVFTVDVFFIKVISAILMWLMWVSYSEQKIKRGETVKVE